MRGVDALVARLRALRGPDRSWAETALVVSVPLLIAALAVSASVYGLGGPSGNQYGFPYAAYPRIPPRSLGPKLFLKPTSVLPGSVLNVYGQCGSDWTGLRFGLGPVPKPIDDPEPGPDPWIFTDVSSSVPGSDPAPAGTKGYFSAYIPVPGAADLPPGWYSIAGYCIVANPSSPGSTRARLLPPQSFKVPKIARTWATLGLTSLQGAAGSADLWFDTVRRAVFGSFLSTTTTATTAAPSTRATAAPTTAAPATEPPATVAPSTEPPTTDESTTTSTTRCTPNTCGKP